MVGLDAVERVLGGVRWRLPEQNQDLYHTGKQPNLLGTRYLATLVTLATLIVLLSNTRVLHSNTNSVI